MNEPNQPNAPERPKPIHSRHLMRQWQQALGIEGEPVHRIVIDMNINGAVRVYVSKYGDTRLLDVIPPGAGDVEIVTVDDPS